MFWGFCDCMLYGEHRVPVPSIGFTFINRIRVDTLTWCVFGCETDAPDNYILL